VFFPLPGRPRFWLSHNHISHPPIYSASSTSSFLFLKEGSRETVSVALGWKNYGGFETGFQGHCCRHCKHDKPASVTLCRAKQAFTHHDGFVYIALMGVGRLFPPAFLRPRVARPSSAWVGFRRSGFRLAHVCVLPLRLDLHRAHFSTVTQAAAGPVLRCGQSTFHGV
jgi:hypothetical protein